MIKEIFMPDIQSLIKEALLAGFSQAGELNVPALEFMPEVRDMCAADRCHSYGRNWTCPPACGTLEDSSGKTAGFSQGILVQTIGKLDDDFDWEAIEETARRHKKNFQILNELLRSRYTEMLAMGAGACDICGECTYPDSPCRFPDRAVPSMEALGLFVSKVCTMSGVPYNNGPKTITYTSCFLIK
jgi:predicted metal-binding protein